MDAESITVVPERFYGQFGEDRRLAAIFAASSPGVCVDVGANDGLTGSVSLHFEQAGWKCVLVEPNPELCARLREERRSFVFEGAASSTHGSVTLMLAEGGDLSHAVSSVETGAAAAIRGQGLTVRETQVRTAPLDSILEEAQVEPGSIAFVSIDVEGHEAEVLNGFDLGRWRPRILIIEDNSIFFGGGVSRQLARSGYVPFLRTGVNDWYAERGDHAILGENHARAYRMSMISARGLMIRRYAVRKVLGLPLVGRIAGRLLSAVRGA